MKIKIFTLSTIASLLWCGTSFAMEEKLSKVSRQVDEIRNQLYSNQMALSAYKTALNKAQEENESLRNKNKGYERLLTEKDGVKSENAKDNESKLNARLKKFMQRRSGGKQFIYIGNNLYRQYNFDVSEFGVETGKGTATTIVPLTNLSPDVWLNISEIHYANNFSGLTHSGTTYGSDKFVTFGQNIKPYRTAQGSPKVVLTRTLTNQCYITFYIGNKIGVIVGENEQLKKIGDKSFLVYEVSSDVDSFTDDLSRMIYVDDDGLYIVETNALGESEGNKVDEVIERIHKTGKLTFTRSVLKVSAYGDITMDNETFTESKFYDLMVKDSQNTVPAIGFGNSINVPKNTYSFNKEKQKSGEVTYSFNKKTPKSGEVLKNFANPDYGTSNETLIYETKILPDFVAKRKAEIKK